MSVEPRVTGFAFVANAIVVGQAAGGAPVVSVVTWMLVLIVLVIAAGLVLLALRRRLLDEADEVGGSGLDLKTLRAMRDRGELTEEEFERARERVLEAYGADATTPATTSPLDGSLRARPGFDLTGEPLPGGGTGPEGPEN